MDIEKLARQMAMKYVYGDHDALTDEQEIQEMTKDISYLVIENQAKNNEVLDPVSKCCRCGKNEGKGKTNQCDSCLMDGIM